LSDTRYPIKIKGKFIEDMTREELIDIILWYYKKDKREEKMINRMLEILNGE